MTFARRLLPFFVIAVTATACAAPASDDIGEAQGAANQESATSAAPESRVSGRVKRVVMEQLAPLSLEDFNEESALVRDLGADDLDLVELAMAIEDEFQLRIPDDDSQKWTTVGDIVDYVVKHLKA